MSKVSIICLKPRNGGTTAMLHEAIKALTAAKFDIEVAFYEPHSLDHNRLSVTVWKLLKRTPKFRCTTVRDQYCEYSVGVYFPALEAGHYVLNKFWYSYTMSAENILVISGSVLPALPAVILARNPLIWTATAFAEDRVNRVRKFGLFRRLFDYFIDAPLNEVLEKVILQRAKILSLSGYTAERLSAIAGKQLNLVLHMPIGDDFFSCSSSRLHDGQINVGYSGRFTDPRKNFSLALKVIKILTNRFDRLKFEVIGDSITEEIKREVLQLNLENVVVFHGHVERNVLPGYLSKFSVLLLTSHQEGLGIACLEAMAAGVPVVATNCGGVNDYIENGRNGFICDFNETDLADRVEEVLLDDEKYQEYSLHARRTIKRKFSGEVFSKMLITHLEGQK